MGTGISTPEPLSFRKEPLQSPPRFRAALKWVKVWTSTHPELKERLEKAVFLLDNVEATLSPDVYKVRSDSKKRTEYLVRVDRRNRTSTCSCPDSQKGNHCKHRLACALLDAVVKSECEDH